MSDPNAFDKTAAAPSAAAASGTLEKSASSVEPSLASGPQTLAGRYELLSLLGVGGMGAVYRARDLELDEIVALKMLRRELMADPQILARFRQEVKLARRVTHRNVARTYDIGEHGGDKFLTMEFIDGESLASLLARDGSMPVAQVVDMAGEVCAGLSAAHAVGIVHRDLKPDNVLLAKDGRVIITDFGIARAAVDDSGLAVKTQGVPLGTPAYMAPEQVEGSHNIDARADIYALGAMLYELLTGDRPWEGDSVFSIAARRLVAPPPDPRVKRPDLPDAVARMVLRCMARKAEDRYGNAAEVARELAGLTLPAQPGITAQPPPRAVRIESTGGDVKILAVLPFRNGGSPEDEYLADGLTDDLIDILSMTKGLKVRPRGVVMGLKGVDRDPRVVGLELDVQVVVEGSVRRAGDRLRVNARVISVADGFQLWAQRFDRLASDFLAVGDDTARAVARVLTLKAGGPGREAPTDRVAIDLYLRARHEYHKYWQEHVVASLELYRQALERAPDDPMILSGYAVALMRHFAYAPDAESSGDMGREAAERALATAPHLGEARVALALYLLNVGDSVGAAREVHRTLATTSGVGEAHELFGRLLVEVGYIDEGISRLRVALASDPRLATCSFEIARAYALLGQLDASDDQFRSEPLEPGLINLYWIGRARIALWHHQVDRAREWLPMLHARGNVVGGALHMLGILVGVPPSDADRRDIEARMGAPGRAVRRRAFFSQIVTEVFASMGDVERALSALAVADSCFLFDVSWLDRCPLLDVLRADARFSTVRSHAGERAAKVREALGVPALAPEDGRAAVSTGTHRRE